MILAGPCVDHLGHFTERAWHQPEPEMVGPLVYRARPAELRTRAYAIDPANLRCAGALAVNWRHDAMRPLGEVVALERDGRGGLWATAHVDSLPHSKSPLYWSVEIERSRDSDPWTITALAVTPSPAAAALSPLRVLDGELPVEPSVLRRVAQRDGYVGELLKRAATSYLERRYRYDARLTISGAAPAAAVRSTLRRQQDAPPTHGWVDPDGRPLSVAIGARLGTHPTIAVR